MFVGRSHPNHAYSNPCDTGPRANPASLLCFDDDQATDLEHYDQTTNLGLYVQTTNYGLYVRTKNRGLFADGKYHVAQDRTHAVLLDALSGTRALYLCDLSPHLGLFVNS